MFTYRYDILGRLLERTDALGAKESFAYDDTGNVIKSKDRNQVITTISYKPGTNLPTSTVKSKAGEEDETLTAKYDGFGRVTSQTNENGTIGYTYTYNGLPKTVTTLGKTLTYQYNNKQQVTGVTDYAGNETGYTYDNMGRVQTVTQNGSTISCTYTNRNQPETVTIGNALKKEYQYNTLGNITTLTNRKGAGYTQSVGEYTYLYDDLGNQIQRNVKDWSGGYFEQYAYDALGRMKMAYYNGNREDYQFDANGNIQKVTMSSDQMGTKVTGSTTYTYDANNRLQTKEKEADGTTQRVTFQYDSEGNLVSKMNGSIQAESGEGSVVRGALAGEIEGRPDTTAFYRYNKFNQLTEYAQQGEDRMEYTYNAAGLRETKAIWGFDPTYYYYSGNQVVNEGDETGITATNLLAGSEIIGRVDGDGTRYYVKNGHGDVLGLVDETGAQKHGYRYDPWGSKIKEMSGEAPNPIGYAGEYADEESGLIYLRARYYDPELGRFISEDPHWTPGNMIYGDNPGENPVPDTAAIMQSGNLYVYCTNNPINFWDPSGSLEEEDLTVLDINDQKRMHALTEEYNTTKSTAVHDAIRGESVRIRKQEKYRWKFSNVDENGIYKDDYQYLSNQNMTINSTVLSSGAAWTYGGDASLTSQKIFDAVPPTDTLDATFYILQKIISLEEYQQSLKVLREGDVRIYIAGYTETGVYYQSEAFYKWGVSQIARKVITK